VNRIKQLRKEHGFSQQSLATELNVNQTAVSQWERGVTTPSSTILFKLCDLLHTSSDYLLNISDIRINHNQGDNDPLILNMVLSRVNKVMKRYQSDLLNADNDKQQIANFLLDSWVNIIIRSVLQNDDMEDPHFYMKVAESLNSLNSDGFLEVCKRINELSRLEEFKNTQK